MSFNLKRDMGVTTPEPPVPAEEPTKQAVPCPQCEGAGMEPHLTCKSRRCGGAGIQKEAQVPLPEDENDPMFGIPELGSLTLDDEDKEDDVPLNADNPGEPQNPKIEHEPNIPLVHEPGNPEDDVPGEDPAALRVSIMSILRSSFDKTVAETFDFVADMQGVGVEERMKLSGDHDKPSVRAMSSYIIGQLHSLDVDHLKDLYSFINQQ